MDVIVNIASHMCCWPWTHVTEHIHAAMTEQLLSLCMQACMQSYTLRPQYLDDIRALLPRPIHCQALPRHNAKRKDVAGLADPHTLSNATGHNYIGHNYTGHRYIGRSSYPVKCHNYIGPNYIGRCMPQAVEGCRGHTDQREHRGSRCRRFIERGHGTQKGGRGWRGLRGQRGCRVQRGHRPTGPSGRGAIGQRAQAPPTVPDYAYARIAYTSVRTHT